MRTWIYQTNKKERSSLLFCCQRTLLHFKMKLAFRRKNMKISGFFTFFGATALLVTGCSKSNHTGTKVRYDVYKQVVDELPTGHPYLYATISYYIDDYGKENEEVGICYAEYVNGEWEDITSRGHSSIINYLLPQKEKPFSYEHEKDVISFFINPLSVDKTYRIMLYDPEEDTWFVVQCYETLVWNNFGLLTYYKYVLEAEGYDEYKEFTITYSEQAPNGLNEN